MFLIEINVFLIEWINSGRKEDIKGLSWSLGGSFSFGLGGSDLAWFGREGVELFSFGVLKMSFTNWSFPGLIPFK
jgi:hypothetical protein